MSRLGRLIRQSAGVASGGGVITPPDPGTARLWSDPGTWVPGSTDVADVPQAGESFEIGADSIITLDVQTPALGNVMVYGTLIVSNDVDTGIDYKSLMFMPGSKLVFADGVAGHYLRKFTLRPRGTITGSTPRMVVARTGQAAVQMGFNNSGSDRSMMFEDGAEVMGGPPKTTHHWRLANHVNIGDTSFRIRSPAAVKAGDEFVICTTDYRGQSLSEAVIVAADSTGDTITITSPFTKFHWGKLQWVTKTAPRVGHMSLVDEGWRPATDAPYTLDESAHVIRLTRSITVDGSMDGNLGGRVMIHGKSGTMLFRGWRQTHMGVAGHQQWYGGFHHHMVSYEMPDGPNAPSNGNFIGGSLQASLCSGHVIEDCAVDRSKNRGMVPHGSNGITYRSNVGFDIYGSFMFLEEGSARKLVIDDNHSILTRPVTGQNVLQVFDTDQLDQAGAAAFWYTNPDNTFTNNSGSDCLTSIWNAFTNRNFDMPVGYGCFGLSKNIPMAPGWLSILEWDNNEANGHAKKGILTDFAQGDEAGNVASDGYPDMASPAYQVVQVLSRPKMSKGSFGGYMNRVKVVEYRNPVISNICGTGFNGATQEGSISANGLAVCESLNATARPPGAPTYDAVGNSYHGTLVFPGWIVVGYSFNGFGVDDEPNNNGERLLTARGMFKMWSEYLHPITFWVRQSPGIELLNSDFGWRTPAQHLEQEAPYNTRPRVPDRDGDLSGATKMDYPYLGGTAGMWWIWNIPFATYGAANLQEALPIGGNNGMLTTSRFYGVYNDYDNVPGSFYTAGKKLDWRRLNPADRSEVGHYTTPEAVQGVSSPVNFHHCVVMEGGLFELKLPAVPSNYVRLRVMGAREPGNPPMFKLPFDGTKVARVSAGMSDYDMGPVNGYYTSAGSVSAGQGRRYTAAASYADLRDGAANRFWQDAANSCVYIKFEGGLNFPGTIDPNSEGYDFWDSTNGTTLVVSHAASA